MLFLSLSLSSYLINSDSKPIVPVKVTVVGKVTVKYVSHQSKSIAKLREAYDFTCLLYEDTLLAISLSYRNMKISKK